MFHLLLLLGFVAMAAGVFVAGFGIPIRETPFGAAMLMIASVAITGGLVLVGLAAAVRELQRVVQGLKSRVPAGSRPVRPVERKDGERRDGEPRGDGADRRSGPPRLPVPESFESEVPHSVPPRFDAPDAPGSGRMPGPERARRAMAEIETVPRPTGTSPDMFEAHRTEEVRRPSSGRPQPVPPVVLEPVVPEVRQAPAVSPQNIFDMVWPSERRDAGEVAEQRTETPPATRHRPVEPMVPPTPPASSVVPVASALARAVRAEPRLPSILKSGVIDEMAYTLFTDGSIEAQMPDGAMRFASIEELRRHLEKHEE
jgi:hypothetical protein